MSTSFDKFFANRKFDQKTNSSAQYILDMTPSIGSMWVHLCDSYLSLCLLDFLVISLPGLVETESKARQKSQKIQLT